MKRHIVCLTAILAVLCGCAQAQDWKIKGMVGGAYNITDVSDNWSGAEKNSQNWGAKLDVTAERDTSETNWANILKEEYGRTKTAGNDEQTSADIFYLTSVYSIKMSYWVNPYVSLVVDTQHWKVLDPVTYTESVGDGVWLINSPKQQLKTRAGFAAKQMFDSVKDKTLATGIVAPSSLADDPTTAEIEQRKNNIGGEWITNYEIHLNNDVMFSSEAKVFTAFKGGANLRWDNTLNVKLSSIATLQLNYLAIYTYDNFPHPVWPQDVEKRLTVMFGVSYNLF